MKLTDQSEDDQNDIAFLLVVALLFMLVVGTAVGGTLLAKTIFVQSHQPYDPCEFRDGEAMYPYYPVFSVKVFADADQKVLINSDMQVVNIYALAPVVVLNLKITNLGVCPTWVPFVINAVLHGQSWTVSATFAAPSQMLPPGVPFYTTLTIKQSYNEPCLYPYDTQMPQSILTFGISGQSIWTVTAPSPSCSPVPLGGLQ